MENKLLLPTGFKVPGLWMLLIGPLGVCIATSGGLINVYRVIEPTKAWADGSYPYPSEFWQANTLLAYVSLGITVCGFMFFFFSKEKDEFIYRVRLESLQFASTIQIILTFLACIYFLFAEGVAIESMIPSSVTLSAGGFWILYILRYSYIVFFKSKLNSEKQLSK
ncbi:hypothetical protein MTX78_23850 (plasmid) [Hymenobacter tibetensis]|uniref:DUF2569 domain-containing protein n=1 Tax=Hymenobacter tibetensis TaxID=497967 RepID=A0ABY4D816_9BACT|nr:hypothetical protein [Hymenobacter tibetensis]UOG77381.1 hypothetical protein MTX78_23850 [Hymenobacter tibetensis]